jgi:hypothetical protein
MERLLEMDAAFFLEDATVPSFCDADLTVASRRRQAGFHWRGLLHAALR